MSRFTLLAPITKLTRQLKERGWKGTLTQLYTIGDLKFGDLKGTDRHGNKYYENLDLPYGQHRWVEYSNIHNPDPTMIAPEWHGWMHHVFEETPSEIKLPIDQIIRTVPDGSDSGYGTHLGHYDDSEHVTKAQYNISQYRARGYKVGSLMTEAGEPDQYYKQPGHPLAPDADKGGRFQNLKNFEEWDPSAEQPKK